MIWAKKIQGGALQLVLFVGAIIAVLLLSFILISYSHTLFKKKTDVMVDVIHATNSGLERSFAKEIREGEELVLPIKNDLGIETVVTKAYWGFLEVRKAISKKGKFQFEKRAFVGPSQAETTALYLKDDQRPLVLAGKTKITGTAYLPKRGVKMGNIYGHSYYDSQLIFGQEKRSTASFPQFSKEFKAKGDAISRFQMKPQGENISYKNEMVVRNGFGATTKIIQGDYLRLQGAQLAGNIVVWASQKIIVEASSKLNDVLLMAPTIEIRDWTKGNFQAIAQKTIKVGKGCELNYPSVLAVNFSKKDSVLAQQITPHIELDAYAQVRGILIYQDQNEINRHKPHIHIDTNAKVYGEVYSSQNVEVKGSVHGNVTTAGFVALENGNIYQNHLYNGTINSTVLPEQYAGLGYVGERTNQIIKWLY